MNWLSPEIIMFAALTLFGLGYAVVQAVRRSRTRREAVRRMGDDWGQGARTDRAHRPVAAWWSCFRVSQDSSHSVDDETWADLEMDRLFAWVDRTLTSIGTQTLYGWLREPRGDLARAAERVSLSEALTRSSSNRVKIQAVLSSLGDRVGWDVHMVLSTRAPSLPLSLGAYRALAGGLALMIVVGMLWPSALTLGVVLTLCLTNALLHALGARRIDAYLVSLRDLRALVATTARVRALLPDEPSQRFDRIDADLQTATAVVDKGGATLVLRGMGAGLVETLLEFGHAFFLAEARAYLRVVHAIEANREALVNTVSFLGEMDAALSLAQLRATEANLCVPTGHDPLRLEAKSLVHPLIRDAVPNDITLGPRGLLVTGSNMAGKSTFLRALGLNVLLAQTLGIACAKSFSCSPLRVFASMRAHDDLAASVSLYQAEVLRLRELLEQGEHEPRCLFLLDEVFRGTNPRDRIAASSALCWALAKDNLVVACTHDLGLADLTEDAFDLGHFSERIDGDEVAFDYRLRDGLSTRTNALSLLARLGYPAEVVAYAQGVANRVQANVQAKAVSPLH